MSAQIEKQNITMLTEKKVIILKCRSLKGGGT